MQTLTKIRKGNRLVWPPGTPSSIKRKLRPSYPTNLGTSLKGRSCDCGNPAELVKNGSPICGRCDGIERRMAHMIRRGENEQFR